MGYSKAQGDGTGMDAIRLCKVVEKDGEIRITGLPYKKGERVELIMRVSPVRSAECLPLTAKRLRHSGLIGLWEDRADLPDSATYARLLREQAQSRSS
jgi:hypothetical protein